MDRWVERLILDVRALKLAVEPNTALYRMAFYRDSNGALLNSKVASVEVINILRPIVAIAVYLTFCALALEEFPLERRKLRNGSPQEFKIFAQEVRRYYPFFPAIIGKVKQDFVWGGHRFREDTHVMLDLYGTNHDIKLWGDPETFRPDRFENSQGSEQFFIPQGGSDYDKHHRCAGEWLTVELMVACLELLVQEMTYDVPAQNRHYRMAKMPSIPISGFVMTNVHACSSDG